MQSDPEFEGADTAKLMELGFQVNFYIQGVSHEIARKAMDAWDEETIIRYVRDAVNLLSDTVKKKI